MRAMRTGALAVLVVLLLGCGGGYARRNAWVGPKEARDNGTKALLAYIERKDDRGIANMLSSRLGYGGAWFPDSACRRKFSGVGTIPASGIDAFARCLVNLPLAISPREHPYPDVAILTYAPGIEIEARFEAGFDGKLVWIGYVSRSDTEDALPTVSAEALLALRNEVPALAIEEATRKQIADELRGHAGAARDGPVYTWFKVCVDATGAVSDVDPRQTSSVIAQDVFESWIRQWSFRPFKLGDRPSPVCSLILVDEPMGAAKDVRRPLPVPPEHAEHLFLVPGGLGELLEGTTLIRPDDDTMSRFVPTGRPLVALAAFCVDDVGRVDTAVVMRSSNYRRYDNALVEGIKKWRFPPVVRSGAPVRACSHASFVVKPQW
jgi:TonB family protein